MNAKKKKEKSIFMPRQRKEMETVFHCQFSLVFSYFFPFLRPTFVLNIISRFAIFFAAQRCVSWIGIQMKTFLGVGEVVTPQRNFKLAI